MKKSIRPIKSPFIIGNWKLTPSTLELAVERIKDYIKLSVKYPKVAFAASVPAVFVQELKKKSREDVLVGAQDVSSKLDGAHTGEVAASMVASVGADFSIVGHSEVRERGDTDEVISVKIKNAVNENLRVIFCFGEKTRDDAGDYLNVIKKQILTGLSKLEGTDIKHVVLAYEPVWAIGRKDNVSITPHDLHQMVIFIKKTLREKFSTKVADDVMVVYGGSVTPENSASILFEGEVSGFLVGRASWEKDSLRGILESLEGKKKVVIKLKKIKRKIRR